MEYSTLPQPVTGKPSNHHNEQPGLEVVPDPGPGLEVAPETGLHPYNPERDTKEPIASGHVHSPAAYDQDAYPEVYYEPQSGIDPALPAGAPPEKTGWSKKWLVLGGIALLVVIGAILGGVLGSRAANRSGDALSDESRAASAPASSSPAPSSTATSSLATPTPTSIGQNPPLTAVSFVTTLDGSPAGPATGSVIVLVFKDAAGLLRASIYQTFQNQDANNDPWQDPQLVTTPSPAQNRTGLAMAGYATSAMNKTPRGKEYIQYSLHLIVFYVNETGYVNGLRYQDTAATMGTAPEEMNARGYSVRTGSRVAAYWPWIAFQDWSGFINVAKSLNDVPYSSTQLLDHVGIQGTRLSVVPVSTDFVRVNDSSYGIFYQASDGLLTPLLPGSDTGGSDNITQSWPGIGKFPKITLPRQGSFAAFSHARSADKANGDLVNTYVLYQDDSSRIKQVWTDDSETWKTSSPEVLAKADMGTDISCLTPATSNNTYADPLYLAPQSNLTRCYFQRGGWVIEVQQKGDDWTELGKVPMP